jgi:hypothetical protein
MTATCEITRPGDAPAGYSETLRQSTYGDPPVIYTGACRVQRTTKTVTHQPFGEREVGIGDYQVTIPLGPVAPRPGDQVRVTAATSGILADAVMRVVDVESGSLVWEQVLRCELQRPTP